MDDISLLATCIYLASNLLFSLIETMCSSYERLKSSHQELGITPDDKQLNLAWLRESNEKLRNDVLKVSSRGKWERMNVMTKGEPTDRRNFF